MANEEHLAKLLEGVAAWNAWRSTHSELRPDLSGADLSGANLYEANLIYADLINADLSHANLGSAALVGAALIEANLSNAFAVGADLIQADLSRADLSNAILSEANFSAADLNGADLTQADLSGADLSDADLVAANVQHANLSETSLVRTNLASATLDESRVYGASIWDVEVDAQTSQRDLVITRWPIDVTVDDLEVAQFIYLLMENRRLRKIVDTITSKVVLILGRFTEERKNVLDALRGELRTRNYTPILFDFEKPGSRDLTETISMLAHMACFVIADITDAKSIPQELQKIIPNLPSLPVRPVIQENQYEYAMFKDFGGYLSVLPPWRYRNTDHLLASLETEVIGPALIKAQEIEERRKAFEQELGYR